jgi:undecaprenyl pyrophosphate phosphatase UppP
MAVAALLRIVTSMKLLPFVVYCAALGLALLVAPIG